MRRRPGGVLEQVAERHGLDHQHLGAQARVRAHGGGGVAAGEHPLHRRQPREGLDQGGRVAGGGDEVDVVGGLAPPAQAAGDLHAGAGHGGQQLVAQRLGHGEGAAERDAALVGVGLRRPLDAVGDALPRAGADAGDAGQAVLGQGGGEIVDAGDAEGRPERGGPLRADPVDPRHRGQALRRAVADLLERGDLAGLDELHDLRLEGGADVGELHRPALHGQLGDRLVRRPDPRRPAAVREDAVPDGALDLQQVAEQLQPVGDLGVRGQLPGHPREV